MNLATVINTLSAGVFAGALAWALSWPLLWSAPYLRLKGAFADLVPTVPGEAARRELRDADRDLSLLCIAACAALAAYAALLVYGVARLQGVWMWVLFGLACALFVTWCVFLVRVSLRWRRCRYAAHAHGALASTLGRLALQGHRVFHHLVLGEVTVDHLVMGKFGVFAIKLVARRPGKLGNISRINGRSIEFQDGFALLDTIALTERSARAVADMQVKGLSHRIHVQAVVAAPGWEIAPPQGQVGEVILINEKTAVMLLRNSKPAYHLMDEDAVVLQEHLARVCVNRGL
ncbi:MAG TPA: hypothetical protein VKT74_07685 [Gammaproteobacteria bacterium]|nr:hypothetical protein [Gammaproteobacteria bacterium]